MLSAFFFFGGLADLFLSVMLWFILDSERNATVFVDGNRVYSVTEVIKVGGSVINNDCDDEEEQENAISTSQSFSSHSDISKRMIE